MDEATFTPTSTQTPLMGKLFSATAGSSASVGPTTSMGSIGSVDPTASVGSAVSVGSSTNQLICLLHVYSEVVPHFQIVSIVQIQAHTSSFLSSLLHHHCCCCGDRSMHFAAEPLYWSMPMLSTLRNDGISTRTGILKEEKLDKVDKVEYTLRYAFWLWDEEERKLGLVGLIGSKLAVLKKL